MRERDAILEGWADYDAERMESDLHSSFIAVCVAWMDSDRCRCGCLTRADVTAARREYNRWMAEFWGADWLTAGSFVPYSEEWGEELDPDLAFALKLEGLNL